MVILILKTQLKSLKREDLILKLTNVNRRIESGLITTSLIQQELNKNYNRIATAKLNLVVNNLNSSIESYNHYVILKNRQFRRPKVEDEFLKQCFKNIESNLVLAENTHREIYTNVAEIKEQVDKLNQGIISFHSQYENEKVFLERYLKTKKIFRPFCFYTFN